ncbi:MAG: lipoyl protein ligase domain-containing protein [Acidimicrobiia bacterium]
MVERFAGTAGELHGLEVPDDGVARIWVLDVTAPAVVLGSTQRDDVVDRAAADAAGVEVARRRSGGGAVWVAPGDPHWVDVIVPRGHPLWTDDVGRAFLPIGRAWQAALAAVGIEGTRLHEDGLACGPLGGTVCFAGRGPGEVLVGDAKVVGISQRRTRAAARFQCAVPVTWDPAPLASLLRADLDGTLLAGVGAGIGPSVDGDELVAALVTALDAAA